MLDRRLGVDGPLVVDDQAVFLGEDHVLGLLVGDSTPVF
jgi:hypothetical protein